MVLQLLVNSAQLGKLLLMKEDCVYTVPLEPMEHHQEFVQVALLDITQMGPLPLVSIANGLHAQQQRHLLPAIVTK